VIKDYNNKSLRDAIVPLAITSEYNAYEWLAIRIKRENMGNTIANVQKLFTSFYPTYMYDQVFFDERIEHFYENEAITAQLFKIFSFLAILISCLGLYGLVSFMAVQKTKEVGIRKVLGASVQSIVYMFSKEFTVLIALAFLISAPAGYYFMSSWLSGFYYHTSIGWGVFFLAILFSMVIAWITVGYKALKAALVNPVKSLKSE
jgi:putative ABC transport system permease protein